MLLPSLTPATEPAWTLVQLNQPVHALEFRDKWLYAVSDRQVIRLEVKDLESRQAVQFADVKIQHLALSDDAVFVSGAYQIEYGFVAKLPIASLFETNQEDGILHSIKDASQWSVLDLPSPVTCLALANACVVVGDRTGLLRRLSQSTGELVWKVAAHPKLVTCATVIHSPNQSQWIASGDWGGKIVISDVTDGQLVEAFSLHRDAISELIPASNTLARLYSSSRDGTTRLWYVDQHRLVRFNRQTIPLVSTANWKADVIISATRDAELLWIDMSSAEVTKRLDCPADYIHALAVSPPRIAVSNGRDAILMWR